jgi:hypothetical protein
MTWKGCIDEFIGRCGMTMKITRILISGVIGMGAVVLVGTLTVDLITPTAVAQYYLPTLIPCFAIFGFPIGIILGLRTQTVRSTL